MRSLRFAFIVFIAFGLSCFVTALAPTDAYAEWLEISDDELFVNVLPAYAPEDVTYDLIQSAAGTGNNIKAYGKFTTGVENTSIDGTAKDDSDWTQYTNLHYYSSTGAITGTTTIQDPDYVVDLDGTGTYNHFEFYRPVVSTSVDWFANNYWTLDGYSNYPYIDIFFRFNDYIKRDTKFKIICPTSVAVDYQASNGSSRVMANSRISGPVVYCSTASTVPTESNTIQCTADRNGIYTMPRDSLTIHYCLRVTGQLTSARMANGFAIYLRAPIKLLVYYDSQDILNLQQQTIVNTDATNETIEQQTQQQTETLTDTTGSDSVTDDVVEDATEQFSTKLGFISQTADMTGQLFQALTYEGEGTVHFPGVRYENYQIIQEQDVPILGYLPSTLEDRVRDGVTLVLFLAWLHGIHNIYARIFLGQVEVTTEDE